METKRGSSWSRYGRRFHLRLSYKRPMEEAVMSEYDRRSHLLGKDDKEFLKMCLVVGYQVIAAQGNGALQLALSTNESNNTRKEQPIESVVPAKVIDQQSGSSQSSEESQVGSAHQGAGVRMLAGLLGPARRTQN
ncbi:hypothetical protein [Burkholderia multivorans]|uniref:hypothetical protein n=1 Tax=Burkholderia multivorans TaxID=87883 RepID=UPI001588CE2C|nr:hypothetical protein [Burkholderia multivorans]MDR8877562.1 hypothetical protein [Burkholderia multivorans]MDR8882507.1 hypothetical protein [Burkholderia multivorans]MDR8889432.1 hypothetical protein [Burkholderia multivorans]MDR8908785.1 hypothetical protein [Burkholderia multivorans]MDR8913894.1 hypothetical protein [Burkholderia multivorans]